MARPAPHAPAEFAIGMSPSPLSLPIQVARDQGFFAAEGVRARVVDCSSGPECLDAMFAGRLQMTGSTDLPIALRSFDRTDFAVIATLATASGNIRMIGRWSSGVNAPAGLAGKRIGYLPGTSSDYYLDSFLYFHGVDPARVTKVPLTAETLGAAITSHRVDAVSSYHRLAGPILAGLGADAIDFVDPRIYTETYNLSVARDVLGASGAEVGRVLRALQRAEGWIGAHPAEARAMLAARMKLAPGQSDRLFEQCTYRLGLGQSLMSSLEGIARWVRSNAEPARRARSPNLLQIVDSGPLRAALPSQAAR